eukprot:CCRYP_010775-RA/>CCRYP_010775-RA protein AED:0.48 eAED:0.48 QI:0/-1/0/1/-1/1/1/0/152
MAPLSRVEPGVGPHLEPVEEALRTQFIPALFGGQDPISNELSAHCSRVKQGGLAIRNPRQRGKRLHQTSTEASLLVESLVSNSQLDNEAHLGCVGLAMRDEKQGWRMEGGGGGYISQGGAQGAGSGGDDETGAWLTAIPDRMAVQSSPPGMA